MQRSKEDMSEETFNRVLYWLKRFEQNIVHLQMVGESTLHPRLIEYIEKTSEIVPRVCLSTNGISVTREMLLGMKQAGLWRLTVSIHRPEVAQRVIQMCQEIKLRSEWGTGPINNHTWAGQVSTPLLSPDKPFCGFLEQQQVLVLSDGRVVACSMDAEGISSRGLSVWNDLTEVYFRPYSLCLTCHHKIPEDLFPYWREKVEKDLTRPAAGKLIPLPVVKR